MKHKQFLALLVAISLAGAALPSAAIPVFASEVKAQQITQEKQMSLPDKVEQLVEEIDPTDEVSISKSGYITSEKGSHLEAGDLLVTKINSKDVYYAYTEGDNALRIDQKGKTISCKYVVNDTTRYYKYQRKKPSIPSGLYAEYGDLLSAVELPQYYHWKNDSVKLDKIGSYEYDVTYDPGNDLMYERDLKVTVEVKKKKMIISVIAAVLIIAVIVSAVVIAMTKGKNAAKASGVYANKVADVMYQAGSTDKYSGVVEAADTMDIKADSEKTVKDILVSEGDEVQVGTPLFTYDTKELAAKKESATLELESLNNTLSGYDAQIEQLTKEKKEAPKDQQLDYTLQIQQAQTQQKQTQYDIATKKAEIEKYDESIKNATVNSTMIGVVKKINENQSADTADTAFMTIVATGDYRVKGTIDEQSFLNSGLAEGQAVIVRSRVDESKTWQGTISKVDTENTQTDNSNSGMYDDGSSEQKASKYNFYVQLTGTGDMLLGQHVYVEPDFGQTQVKDGIWIDESYVVKDGDDAYVWTLNKKDKLEKTKVELGDYDENLMMYEIKSGLTKDDYIVWASDDLYEGEPAQTWEEYVENGGGEESVYDDMGTEALDDQMLEGTEGGPVDDGTMDDGTMDEGAADATGSGDAEVQ